jgi:GNAT superfamily N-acetyltransferase
MEIKTYNGAQLIDLIRSEGFKSMPVIPISTQRAISHTHNPRADANDTLMIVAYENDEMIGYLGILPDRIYNTDGESFKCGWLSCMWVNPILRGKGIAKQLLATAFQTWDDHILVTEFTPEAKGLYDRSGNFASLVTNDGLRCYMRFNLHEVLPKKKEQWKACLPLLRMIDGLANSLIDLKLSALKPKPASGLSFTEVLQIDQELDEYIISKHGNQFERRQAAELDWITKYPWLRESKPTEESMRYHFSSVSDRFRNICFKLTKNGEVKGYIHFAIRDNHLKVPYAYFEAEYLGDVVQQVYHIMLEYKLNMLTIFHPEVVSYFKSNSTPFIYKRTIQRRYIITKALDKYFSDKAKLIIQDGDADAAFT